MPSAVEIARGLFGGRVARAGPPVEGRQPEPPASFVGRGSRRNGPRGGCEDRGHGPPDASRLGSPLQRLGSGRASRQLDRRSEAPLVHPSRWPRSCKSSRSPDREKDGVVRWRRVDLKRVIAETFGIDFHERYVGTLLKKLGFSHISAPASASSARASRWWRRSENARALKLSPRRLKTTHRIRTG